MEIKPRLIKAAGAAKRTAQGGITGSFKLSGDVGGRTDFFIGAKKTRRLQVISLSLPANSNLVLVRARFFFNDPEINLRVSVLNLDTTEIRRWTAPTSAGDVPVNLVLLSTTRARNIYLAISGHNIRSTGPSLFRPDDGWWVKFNVVPRS